MIDLLRDFLKSGPAPPLYGFRRYIVGGGNLLNGFPPDFSFDDIHGLIVPQIKRLYVVLRPARTHFLQRTRMARCWLFIQRSPPFLSSLRRSWLLRAFCPRPADLDLSCQRCLPLRDNLRSGRLHLRLLLKILHLIGSIRRKIGQLNERQSSINNDAILIKALYSYSMERDIVGKDYSQTGSISVLLRNGSVRRRPRRTGAATPSPHFCTRRRRTS